MINHAYRHNYAVGAFGVDNLHFLEGVMQAAENCHAPVVLNLIESHFENARCSQRSDRFYPKLE